MKTMPGVPRNPRFVGDDPERAAQQQAQQQYSDEGQKLAYYTMGLILRGEDEITEYADRDEFVAWVIESASLAGARVQFAGDTVRHAMSLYLEHDATRDELFDTCMGALVAAIHILCFQHNMNVNDIRREVELLISTAREDAAEAEAVAAPEIDG